MKATISYKNGRKVYELDGVEVSEQEFDRAVPKKPIGAPMATTAWDSSKELVSKSEGCHSSQVAERNALLARHGVTGAYYRADGSAVFSTRGGRKDLCRVMGSVDRDGGYGDRT